MNTRFKSKAILMALNLPFSSGGNACWFPQTGAAFHGGSAAQSGAISDGQRTWLQTTVTGPGTLKFYWKVSCEADKDSDYLDFSIDGVQQKVIYGETSWAQQTCNIGPRKHTLTWSYEKDNSLSYGTDAGWVDKVEWAESTAHLSAALAIAPSTVTPFVGQDFTISGALTAEGVGVASETVTLLSDRPTASISLTSAQR